MEFNSIFAKKVNSKYFCKFDIVYDRDKNK